MRTRNLKLLPVPKHFQEEYGVLRATEGTAPQTDSNRVAETLARYGLTSFAIKVDIASPSVDPPRLEDDASYRLVVNEDCATISAPTTWGALHGCTTLAQLYEAGTVLCCSIEDLPTYRWRGLMIDVVRHFMPRSVLYETLDLMALFKLNVLHLHLTDDQGFRFRSDRFPELASAQCYSKAELTDLVHAAAQRGIRVVPEIDVLGHTHSWLVSHPEWGVGSHVSPSTEFGVHKHCLDPSNPHVWGAVKHLFTELSEVFVDEYVHIGGDEVDPEIWLTSGRFRQWMDRERLETTREVEARFTNRLVEHLQTLGKRVIGWDEVLHPATTKAIAIQAWRGMSFTDEATSRGHDVIVSAPYYLDLNYNADLHYLFEPGMSPQAFYDAQKRLVDDPRLAHVREGVRGWGTNSAKAEDSTASSNSDTGSVLGGEACMWSELVPSTQLSRRVWSRMPLIAERLWNGSSKEIPAAQVPEIQSTTFATIERLGYGRLDTVDEVPGEEDVTPLLELLEPVKWYTRTLGMERMRARAANEPERDIPRPYTADSSLDRLVDRLCPDSHATNRLVAAWHAQRPIEDTLRTLQEQKHVLARRSDSLARDDALQRAAQALAATVEVVRGAAPPDMNLAGPFDEYLLPLASFANHLRIERVLQQWDVRGFIVPLRRGHINDTYVVDEAYVLQRINGEVFKNPERVIANFQTIQNDLADLVVPLQATVSGQSSVIDVDGSTWRLQRFCASRTFDVLPSGLCKSAGQAVGETLVRLQSLSAKAEQVETVIDGFHDIGTYLQRLDQLSVPSEVATEVAFVNDRRRTLPSFLNSRQLIHGDCKVNNLLFSERTDRVVKIVDWDTLMLGHPAWDFGDLVRSAATGTSAARDAFARADEITRGFLAGYAAAKEQLATFLAAPAYMSLMLGIRFLVDHLQDDVYFKVDRRGDNLKRAREQFELTRRFEEWEATTEFRKL